MRVLVVEDEVRLAELLRAGLKAEGFAVDVSGDGIDAVWRATEVAYDIIVLDIMLPGKNGIEVCRELRRTGVTTPILMLTARTGDNEHAEVLNIGADDFLPKPFSFVVLIAHLRALIRRGTTVSSTLLAAGDLTLDPVRHRCWRGDIEIELTPRQFSLLEYLMSRPGEAISKTEIVEHVWDEVFDGDLNIVEVYVGYLRRKIDAPFGRHAIETLRLVGYRLDPEGG